MGAAEAARWAGLSLYFGGEGGAWAQIFGFPSLIRAVDQKQSRMAKRANAHPLPWLRELHLPPSPEESDLHVALELHLPPPCGGWLAGVLVLPGDVPPETRMRVDGSLPLASPASPRWERSRLKPLTQPSPPGWHRPHFLSNPLEQLQRRKYQRNRRS